MDTDNKTSPDIDQEFATTAKHDDPLLLALLAVCKLLHSPQSIDFLTAGLPLVNNKWGQKYSTLTPIIDTHQVVNQTSISYTILNSFVSTK
jgi:hypothetical protein